MRTRVTSVLRHGCRREPCARGAEAYATVYVGEMRDVKKCRERGEMTLDVAQRVLFEALLVVFVVTFS